MCGSRRSHIIAAAVAALFACVPHPAAAAEVVPAEATGFALLEAAILVAVGIAILALVVWHIRRGTAQRAAVLEDANTHQRIIIEAIPDALFRMDAEGRFVDFKPSEDFSPVIPPKDFLGRTVREMDLPADLILAWEGAFETVRREGGYRTIEYSLSYPEGPHEFEARMVRARPDEYLAIVRDISARKHAETDADSYRRQLELTITRRTSDLIEANVRLQEANRAKSAFLANVSHELRTPLNSVIGFTDLLLTGLAGDLNDEQRHQLTMIRGAGKELLSLVEDVLDYTRIESGKVTALPAEFRLPNLLGECMARIRKDAQVRGLQLELDVDSAPPTMESDRRLIEQVVGNLLSNAVKFTSKGSVRLGAHLDGDETVAIEVVDTGCGIDPVLMGDIFRAFEQGSDDLSARPRGLGLGLAICRELTELLGGNLSLESEQGYGTTARLLLPLRMQPDGRDATVVGPGR